MTNINTDFLDNKETPELTQKTLREKLNELYLNVQIALRDDDPPADKRFAYGKIKKKIELIAKFGTYKNEGEWLTHKEAQDVYALEFDSITFGYDFVRAFGPISPEDEKLLPPGSKKPSFSAALNSAQHTSDQITRHNAGATDEELGWKWLNLEEDDPQERPCPT